MFNRDFVGTFIKSKHQKRPLICQFRTIIISRWKISTEIGNPSSEIDQIGKLITVLSRSEVQIDIISINDCFNSNFGVLNREGGQ